MNQSIYQFKVTTLQGKEISLEDYKGKVILIVNTATRCGRRGQLEDLEKIYQKYKDKGFEVLGFPSNDFAQEPLNGEAIQEYCSINFGVTFPMMNKINVRGENADPLFKFFSDKNQNGVIERIPKWNFYKFLIGKNGKVLDSFWTYRKPTNKKITSAIEKALN